jgi:hypothetical protein|tara:strand:+ start:283 stop:615 length:333 start_codon:yes stop_codon:yes gene_type:complete
MALLAGSVNVSADGSAQKSGLAAAIYDEFVNNYTADMGSPLPAGADGKPIKNGYAIQATHLAVAIVNYITDNAQVSTSVETEILVSACTTGGVIAGINGTANGTGSGQIS